MDTNNVAILFLENSPEKVQQVRDYCPTADTILVKETPHARAVKLLENTGIKYKGTSSELRLKYKSAITPAIISRIKEWVNQHKNAQKYVLFDWGRTITQLEGVRLNKINPAKYDAVLNFVCNGARRVLMLRSMFSYLHSAGCKIYILTNNKSCKAQVYKGLLQHLAGASVPLQFICSGLGTANGHKGRALAQHKTFKAFCRKRKHHITRKRSHN